MYNFMPVAESVQIFAVGFDDLLIPPERILSLSVHVTVTVVITIYIDETITLLHFSSRCGYKVCASPHGITHQFNTIFNGFIHRPDMITQIVNTIGIVELSIFASDIVCTKSVFYNK